MVVDGLWAGVTKEWSKKAELGSSDTDVPSRSTRASLSEAFNICSDVVVVAVSTDNGAKGAFSDTMMAPRCGIRPRSGAPQFSHSKIQRFRSSTIDQALIYNV